MKIIKEEDYIKPINKYSVAPYNFVSFPAKSFSRYKDFKELPSHTSYKNKNEERSSGYIDIELEALNPIIISDGKQRQTNDIHFFQNLAGQKAIPANSFRGLIRTNTQILSHSCLTVDKNSSDIEDNRFLFRDIAGNNSMSKYYGNILAINPIMRVSKNLKTGVIRKEGSKYFITPSKSVFHNRPYFRIDEIFHSHLLDILDSSERMYNKPDSATMMKLLNIKNSMNAKNKFDSLNQIYRLLRENKFYKPYYKKISYEYNTANNKITKVGKVGEYNEIGWILSSNHINRKRSHYIMPDKDSEIREIEVNTDLIEAYKDDLVRTRKAKKTQEGILINEESKYYELPTDSPKPIFYISIGEKGLDDLHFGFTPYLRMTYPKSVHDGIPIGYRESDGISYTEAMFGFTKKEFQKDKFSYRSRIAFTDMIAKGNPQVDKEASIKVILGSPKATSYNLYLEQDISSNKSDLKIYKKDFNLRGFKHYWLKNYIEIPKEATSGKEEKNENVRSYLHPLEAGTRFVGKIYFESLSQDELGLLLLAIKPKVNAQFNLGMAKSLGYGRIRVNKYDLFIEDLDKKYNDISTEYYKKEEDKDKLVYNFVKYFQEKANVKDYYNNKSIKEFFYLKTKVIDVSDSNLYRHMKVHKEDGKEFANRLVLPTVLEYEETLKNKTLKPTEKKYNENYNKHENNQKKSTVNSTNSNLKNKGDYKHKDKKRSESDSFGNTMDILKDFKIED